MLCIKKILCCEYNTTWIAHNLTYRSYLNIRLPFYILHIYIYGTPPPLTYPFVSFETQGWVGAGGSGTERRPENAKN